MTAAYSGPDRRTVLAADAAGAHSQRKAAEERAALAEQQLATVTAERDELLAAAKLVLAWYVAENDHSGTTFYERVGMCCESETAIRAAIAKVTGSAS